MTAAHLYETCPHFAVLLNKSITNITTHRYHWSHRSFLNSTQTTAVLTYSTIVNESTSPSSSIPNLFSLCCFCLFNTSIFYFFIAIVVIVIVVNFIVIYCSITRIYLSLFLSIFLPTHYLKITTTTSLHTHHCHCLSPIPTSSYSILYSHPYTLCPNSTISPLLPAFTAYKML